MKVAEAIKAGGEDLQIYTSGATNIFRYPELAEGEKASKLIGTLEQKEVLQEFVGKSIPAQRKKRAFRFISVTRARCSP